jgi:cytochrome c-type biogenesis protein
VEIQHGGRQQMARIARDTSLFIAGFSAVFIALGLSATTLGHTLVRNQATITRIAGLVVLGFALFTLGSLVLHLPWLYQEKRFHPALSRFGPFAAPVAGAAFGFGWTPCIGPVLGSVLAVAATQSRAAQGALLLAVYSAGLGLPFLATGLAFGRLAGALGWVKRHFTAITIASAAALAFFGVLLTLNRLTWVTSQLQTALGHIGLGRLVFLG